MNLSWRILLAFLSSVAWPQDVSRMRADLEFLTSPPLEGRASLGKGAEISARFLAAEFQKAGLAPLGGSYLQEFRVAPAKLDLARSTVRIRREGKVRNYNPASVYFAKPAEAVKIQAA